MFTIYTAQLEQLASPLVEKLMLKALAIVKRDYPAVAEGRNDNELLAQVRLLSGDSYRLNFRYDENLVAYFVLCLRHRTNYDLLLQNRPIQSVIRNAGFHEAEKVYLIDEILTEYGL